MNAVKYIIASFVCYIMLSSAKHKKEYFMKENKLADLAKDFASNIISLVGVLKDKHESIISNQIGRSGTSIGANFHEANYAQGRKDFI